MSDHRLDNGLQDSNDEMVPTQRLEHYALPRFTRACRYAESQNLQASVDEERDDLQLICLRLNVRHPGNNLTSSYQLHIDKHNQRVIHEQHFAAEQSSQREDTLPTAINAMVMDSRLEAFFSRAFNMLLPYLKDSHPPGF